MIRLVMNNVERVVMTEEQAEKLECKGFKRVDSVKKGEPSPKKEKPLSDMTVKELRAYAKEKGIEVVSSLGKAELIEILGGDSNGNE